MASGNDRSILLPVRSRRIVEDISLPFLVRMRLYDHGRKPRRFGRLKRKMGQVADDLVHGWLSVPSRGEMFFNVGGDRSRVVGFDAHQSAYLAFASREMYGGYEPVETMFLETVLPKSAVFYDVGCNWGYFSLLAASHPVFQGQVHAVDVSSEMNGALERMSASLELPALKVAGYGLSDKTGTVGLSDQRSAHLIQVISSQAGDSAPGRSAAVRRLDDLALPPPDLIKIDVEDHEAAVFEGGCSTLKEHRPLILFECRGDSVGTAAGDVLRSLDYRLYSLRLADEGAHVIDLSPVDAGELPTMEQTNLVAVAGGDEPRWFA